MTKVSIIMASYNHEKFVHEAVQSVLDQSFQDFELIIIDDASTDNTVDILKEFRDARIKLITSSANRGQFVTTNQGLAMANGEYIAILNSDDVFTRHKLEKQVTFLDSNPSVGAVFTYADIIDEESKPYKKKSHLYTSIFDKTNRTRLEWLHYFFFYGNCLCHPSVLIRSKCHKELGFYDPRFANCADFQFWIRLTAKYDIHIIQEKLTRFRVLNKEGNMSGASISSTKRMHWEDYQAKMQFFEGLLSDSDFFLAFPEARKFNVKNQGNPQTSYLLARLTLELNNPYFDALGLRVLFELMDNQETINELKNQYDFTYKDLIHFTGKANPFQTNKKNSTLKTLLSKLHGLLLVPIKNKLST